ncbi:MAG: ABC transporter permease [Actinomycetota bacterium]
MATSIDFNERTSEPPHLRVGTRLRELWVFREIFVNLVRKDLKVKYAASVLGTVWSLLNPVVFLLVFSFVSKLLGGAAEDYPVFLLSGLLAWNLFSGALSGGAQVCVGNANLIKKVYFPREILPLSVIGVAVVDLLLQSAVFFLFILIRPLFIDNAAGFALEFVWLYPLSIVALLLFTTAVTLWVSALNVRYRDIEHLLGLLLLVWFWMTPIVYATGVAHAAFIDKYDHGVFFWRIYQLNPMTWVVSGLQRALYHHGDAVSVLTPPSDGALILGLSVVILASTALLYLTWRTFFALSGDFAEEL